VLDLDLGARLLSERYCRRDERSTNRDQRSQGGQSTLKSAVNLCPCAYRVRNQLIAAAFVTNVSGLAQADPAVVERGIERLRGDLETGRWYDTHADILELTELDVGIRIVVGSSD
jgi:hypothetical protein